MDTVILVLVIILLCLQVLTYFSVAFLYSWLKARVIQPSQVSTVEEVEDDPEDQGARKDGMYL